MCVTRGMLQLPRQYLHSAPRVRHCNFSLGAALGAPLLPTYSVEALQYRFVAALTLRHKKSGHQLARISSIAQLSSVECMRSVNLVIN